MQGNYTHIPRTNYVPREYCVAAILLFLFMVFIIMSHKKKVTPNVVNYKCTNTGTVLTTF